MIFRKPYAFLIKYFRLINIALCIVSGYVIYKTYNIIGFFSDYIANGYTGIFYNGFYNNYISSFIYILLVIMLIGLGSIILLFIYKKKPIKEYLFIVIYYIILIVYLNIVKSTMISLQSAAITAETARAFRDISMIMILPQIIIFIIFLFRSFGYNLKKFEFDKDIKEISNEDNEEFEFTFKNDNVKIKRTARRFGREFIYYVKENKLIVIIISIVLLILGIYFGFKTLPEIVDKNYNQGESFTINNITYNIKDSIVTNIDYKGDIITENSYYIVTRLEVINNELENYKIDYNSFTLKVNDDYIYPITDKNKYFIDYANNNSSGIIKGESKRVVLLIYKIDTKDIKKNYELRIDNGSVYTKNKTVARFNYVNITPILIDKVVTEGTINMGSELDLNNTNLGNTKVTFSNPVLTTKYMYEYDHCIGSKCSKYNDIVSINYENYDKILIVLDYSFNIDNTTPYYENYKQIGGFASNFIKIKYNSGDEFKYFTVKNVTPEKLKNKLVLETSNEITNIKDVYLSITIRNKEYLIKLK